MPDRAPVPSPALEGGDVTFVQVLDYLRRPGPVSCQQENLLDDSDPLRYRKELLCFIVES